MNVIENPKQGDVVRLYLEGETDQLATLLKKSDKQRRFTVPFPIGENVGPYTKNYEMELWLVRLIPRDTFGLKYPPITCHRYIRVLSKHVGVVGSEKSHNHVDDEF